MRRMLLKPAKVAALMLLLSAVIGCAQNRSESEIKKETVSSLIGIPDPDDGIRIPLNFPAPRWEVGDWWEIDYQNYVYERLSKSQPLNSREKVGWATPQRWKYEVVGIEKVRGDDCYALEMRYRGSIHTLWLRKKDLLVMREMSDALYKRRMRENNPALDKQFFPKPRENTNIGPFGRNANYTLPLGIPLFGVAWNKSVFKQTLTDISNVVLIEKANDEIRERIHSLIGPRSAKIVIDNEGGGYPETQYWNSALPWFVYGEDHSLDGPERSRYWLVNFGKKGDSNDTGHP